MYNILKEFVAEIFGESITVGLLIVTQLIVGVQLCYSTIANTDSLVNKLLMILFALACSLIVLGMALNEIVHSFTTSSVKKRMFSLILSYALIIFTFSIIYSIIGYLNNSAFSGLNTANPFSLFADYIYFSAMIFTAFGYGDIKPVSASAKLIVTLEVFMFVILISIIFQQIAKASQPQIANQQKAIVRLSLNPHKLQHRPMRCAWLRWKRNRRMRLPRR